MHKGLAELADAPVMRQHEVPEVLDGLRYECDDSLITRNWVQIPSTLHDEKVQRNCDTSVVTIIASPRTSSSAEVFSFVTRNHASAVALKGRGGVQDLAAVCAAIEEVFDQDRRIVESQRSEQIPIDLRDKLRLKVPDASAVTNRRLLLSWHDG